MGKGSNTTSSTTSSSPDPQAAAAYRDLLTRAQGVASTPYQAYTGDLTAGVNSQQNAGISGINAAAGYANPYIQNASSLASSATAPITGSTIQQYQNPYTQQVVDATTAQMRNDFGQQQASLTGNQIAQGALGGNATGVARGVLAGQQGRTMASTVAGLYDKSYQQALQAAQQQQQTGLAGANAQAQYGLSGQNAALTGATAQVGAGSLQQQTEQQRLNALYGQYQQQQAYPYQQAQWLAGMATGVGSNLGGTGTGTTTGPAPNSTGQWLGAGLSAAGMFLSDREAKEDIEHIGSLNDGQKIYRYRYKGQPGYHIGLIAQEAEKHNPDSVQRGLGGLRYVDMEEATEEAAHRRASGGGVGAQPWGGGVGWIPQMNIHGGSGAPQGHAPSLPDQKSGFDPEKIGKGLGSVGKGLGGLDWGGAYGAGLGNLSGDAWGGGGFTGGDAYGGSSASPLAGLDASDYGVGFADGGAVMTDEDPPMGLAAGQQLASGSPWQMRPTGQGQVQVINTRTGQIIYTGTHAGASSAAASMNARQRAAGGAVDPSRAGLGYAGGGVPGFDDRFGAAYAGVDPEEARYAEGEGFRDMMKTADPFGEANRINAHDALRRGDGIVNYNDPPVFDQSGKQLGNQTSLQGVATLPPDAPVVAAESDDEEAPSAPPAGRGLAARPPVMAADDRQPGAARGRQGDGGGGILGLLSPNASNAMITAGLGMLSSRSPFLGNQIGEGGLAGMSAYGSAEEKDRQVAAEAAKLSREARKEFVAEAMGERKQSETERHNMATEKNAASDRTKAPMGMRFNTKGELEDIPGWIPTLEKAAKARKGPEGEVMDDDTAKFMADRIIAGDTKVLTGLGRGAQGAANILKVQKLVAQRAASGEEISGAAREILQNAAQFEGLKTAERTQAQIMSKLSVYGRTAFRATDIALRLSEEVPRTNWQPINKVINAAKTKTGDPKIVAFGQALQTLSNEYARAIGGGHGTVHMQEQAERRLNEAQSKEQLKAIIAVMRQEILAEESAMPEARQHIRNIYNPKPGEVGRSIAGEHGMTPPAGPVTGASGFKPPEGAIPRLYQGKTYYYDPATKQPYPGQQ